MGDIRQRLVPDYVVLSLRGKEAPTETLISDKHQDSIQVTLFLKDHLLVSLPTEEAAALEFLYGEESVADLTNVSLRS